MKDKQLSFLDFVNSDIQPTYSKEVSRLRDPMSHSIPLTGLSFIAAELVINQEVIENMKINTSATLFSEIPFGEVGYYPLENMDEREDDFAGYLISRNDEGFEVTAIYKVVNHFYTMPEDEYKSVLITEVENEVQLSSITCAEFIVTVEKNLKVG